MTDLKYKGKTTIDLLSVSRPVILGKDNLAGTILESPVGSALKILKKVIRENREVAGREKAERDNKGFYEDWTFKVNNNIVAFIGERGTGKSSCMLSTLKCMKEAAGTDRDFDDCYFLQIIDPSFFDEHHNIIELFIGELYSQFLKLVRNDRKHAQRDQILELQACFSDLKRNMRYLDNPPTLDDNQDAGESLDLLASGVYLQTNVRKVISRFLEFVGKKTLVTAIDDLDLSVQRSYDMMEQIRKYLVLPEAVILFSAKIQQLHQAVQLRLMEVYGVASYHDESPMSVNISDMADRYITKFLPLNHRIYMPEMTVMLDNALKVINVGDDQKSIEFPNISDKVLDLIFQKTRFLFYNSHDHKSWIIPRNLRSLAHLVKMLWDMEDFDSSVRTGTEDTVAARRNNANKEMFRNFFFTDWLNRLSPEKADCARSLMAETEPAFFNKRVLGVLSGMYYNNGNEVISAIEDSQNVAANISIGDVQKVLNDARNRNSDIDDRMFLFFVESLYSMRLYEYYDAMTDAMRTPARQPEGNADRPMLHGSGISLVPDFMKLAGGAFFCADRSSSLLPEGRDRRILDGSVINTIIRDLLERYNRLSRQKDFESKQLPEDFVAKTRMIEFFAFCSLRHVQAKDRARLAKLNDRFRQAHEAYYLGSFRGVRNILFDVVAPLFNCIRPFEALSRYDAEFADMCRGMDAEGKMSLSNQLLKESRRYGDDPAENADLASRICLRNMEVMQDVYTRLCEHKDTYRPSGGGDIAVYREFFDFLGSYEIATYRLKEDSAKHHKISLEPMKHLADTLKETMASDDLRESFDSCFAIDESEIPQKGSQAYNKLTSEYIYRPDDVRRIVYAAYPEYEHVSEISDKLKHPRLRTGSGTEIMVYLAKTFPDTAFLKIIDTDLQKEYLTLAENHRQKAAAGKA